MLREAELVRMEKRAQWRLYEINPEKLEDLEGWLRQMRRKWEERFEVLDELLRGEVKSDPSTSLRASK